MSRQKVNWKNAPPLPDAEKVVQDVSCYGSIGHALQQALFNDSDELEGHNNTSDKESESISSYKLGLEQPALQQILTAFGNAIAKTHQEQHEVEWNPRQRYDGITAAPAALMRGRVDHFNRRGSKWRLVVHDAELVERKSLDRNRRKRERLSLWNAIGKGSEAVKIPRLEILAYNDIE